MYLSGRKQAQTYKSQQHTASVSQDVSRRADDNARPKRRGPGPAEGAGAVERHLARVRNGAGDKGIDSDVKLVVDEGDAMRSELAIAPDLFGLLGGRETYVVDASGTVVGVHNNQFDPASHVTTALAAAETIPNLNPLEQFAASLGIELP